MDVFSQRAHIRDDLVESSLIRKADRFAGIPVRFAMATMIVSVDDNPRFRQFACKNIIASDMFGVTMRNLNGRFRFLLVFGRPFHREDFLAIT
ncbi:hypothetical protein SDC9_192897 [bioreactor metagenome]|uniref:Uncharacterized protein n=1 Tax=bioreactor metagenome TaxID=1076179 RepID=A0A645I2D9_9ZZZZ